MRPLQPGEDFRRKSNSNEMGPGKVKVLSYDGAANQVAGFGKTLITSINHIS